ncbi:MAG: hypothetical protein JO142_16660 [Burkholderiales bacterium]|nr:hypothetical protein [Burkholderiales bacterium]
MASAQVKHGDIAVGQALPWDIHDSSGAVVLRQGALIASVNQLERMMNRGLYADERALAQTRMLNARQSTAPASVVATLLYARRRMALLLEMMESTKLPADFQTNIHELVGLVDAACSRDADIALAFVLLCSEGRYAVQHAINVATVVRLVARAMCLPRAEEASLIAAALTMNLTVARLQDDLRLQAGPLTPIQRSMLENHPADTRRLLETAGVTDTRWLDTVAQHHEHHDGSGYPGHTEGHALSSASQLLALADTFCACLVTSAHRPGITANVAMRRILLERGKAFDSGVTRIFHTAIGSYPPGSLVRLVNGEKGIVTRHGSSPQFPRVASLIGPHGMPMGTIVHRDTQQAIYAVEESIDPEQFAGSIDVQPIWGPLADATGPVIEMNDTADLA